MQQSFASLPVKPEILQAIQQMGFEEMTEVQQKAIPPMLAGQDVIAKAPTGTGKTLAFGIPLIEHCDTEKPDIQSLILAPTRELATQICEDLKNLTRFLPQLRVVVVYGGQSMERQKQQLKKGAHILVATPGRLLDLMQHRAVSLKSVTTAVLDEADRMLDMGFYKDVRKILDSLKAMKQMCMFSATISREVMDIGWLFQRDPEEITVLPVEESEPKIDQYSVQCIGREKIEIILRLMKQFEVSRAIIFCNTKYTTGMVAEQLHAQKLNTACLHGDMRQSERNKIMEQYKAGRSTSWSPPTWPPAASTSAASRWSLTTTSRRRTTPTCTASAAPAAPRRRASPLCCTPRTRQAACKTSSTTPARTSSPWRWTAGASLNRFPNSLFSKGRWEQKHSAFAPTSFFRHKSKQKNPRDNSTHLLNLGSGELSAQPKITSFACCGWWKFQKIKRIIGGRRCEKYENTE